METTIHDSGNFVRILKGGGDSELENIPILPALSMGIRGGSGAAPPPKPPPANPAKANTRWKFLRQDTVLSAYMKQPRACNNEHHT
ncbi:hypothetical protein Y032_0258g445 [Ancylostoma ceylanicum]|uniref:Uncharacterized protein n=1 Tax=Ancylostoma ceylanicum TaxID=53326 RepID=A0A016SBJ1_9BILA|nr:hypothetical protein Y032_0258g445 [Ancylostoma ceylanicum]